MVLKNKKVITIAGVDLDEEKLPELYY